MNHTQRVDYNYFSFIFLPLVGLFAFWWLQPSHIPNNFGGLFRLFDLLLFILITYVIWHPIVMSVFTWLVASHIKRSVPPTPEAGLKVAFITTFVPGTESVKLLETTLPAMAGADYPHHTWLLDEGNDPAARELCARLGVYHFSRKDASHYNTDEGKFARKTKGGNHNSWYDVYGSYYDIVAQIDTDFKPRRDFLTRTLGYFRDPKIAFVGTPQVYGNTMDSFVARGAAEQTYGFYGYILRGFDGMKATLLIGANHIIRVKALESVDHYSAHLTEDLLTGMKLHASGWQSAYIPEPLAIGEGPNTWDAFFSQQMRWAHGCMDILLHHSFKLFKSMTARQKLYYFFLQQHYFGGLAMVLSTFGLGLYFAFGLNVMDVNVIMFLFLYGAVVLTCLLSNLFLQRFNVRPGLEKGLLPYAAIINIVIWPIFFLAFIAVIRGKRLTFKVTPKGDGVNDDLPPLGLFKAHMYIALYSLVCLVLAVSLDRTAVIMLFWCVTSLLLMMALPAYIVLQRATRTLRSMITRPATHPQPMVN